MSFLVSLAVLGGAAIGAHAEVCHSLACPIAIKIQCILLRRLPSYTALRRFTYCFIQLCPCAFAALMVAAIVCCVTFCTHRKLTHWLCSYSDGYLVIPVLHAPAHRPDKQLRGMPVVSSNALARSQCCCFVQCVSIAAAAQDAGVSSLLSAVDNAAVRPFTFHLNCACFDYSDSAFCIACVNVHAAPGLTSSGGDDDQHMC